MPPQHRARVIIQSLQSIIERLDDPSTDDDTRSKLSDAIDLHWHVNMNLKGSEQQQLMIILGVEHAGHHYHNPIATPIPSFSEYGELGIDLAANAALFQLRAFYPKLAAQLDTECARELLKEAVLAWPDTDTHRRNANGSRARSKWAIMSDLIARTNIGRIKPGSLKALYHSHKKSSEPGA